MKLSAGRELDDMVSEKIMGWKYQQSSPDPKKYFCREYGNDAGWWLRPNTTRDDMIWSCASCSPPPEYSADITAAWEVLNRLPLDLWPEVGRMNTGSWYCEIVQGAPWPTGVGYLAREVAETAPLAICRAALKAARL